jgi:putative transposase
LLCFRRKEIQISLSETSSGTIKLYGIPDIFNTDQGSQYTSLSFTNVLKDHAIKISMDGKGRWMDNVFIERLWRSLKYECVYFSEPLRALRPQAS